MNPLLAIKMIDLAITGVTMASEIYNDLQAQRSVLQRAIDEDRDPTPEEWAALESSIDGLRSELHG